MWYNLTLKPDGKEENIWYETVGMTIIFLGQQQDFPSHMTPIGTFTYLRTYSRYPTETRT
jgi:hypothetical protein